jgi:hypothetical protein
LTISKEQRKTRRSKDRRVFLSCNGASASRYNGASASRYNGASASRYEP